MSKLLHCLMFLLWPVVGLYASPATDIKPLRVGDVVPDMVLTNMGNYKTNTARLSDFKGKLVLLDFWSTWCGSCMDAMPHMQELQQQFGGRLQVVLVNGYETDNLQRVQACFAKRKSRTGFTLTLPYSVQQTSLTAYFPHRFVPHYVWIGSDGIVAAITSGAEVTAENIHAIINGQPVKLHTKNDMMEFDANKPLFVDGNGGNGNNYSYRSILTGYQEGLGCRSGIDQAPNGRITRFYMVNYPALSLLRTAYPDAFRYPANRMVFDKADASKFSDGAASGILRYSNSYCYELSVPPCTDAVLKSYMREDLFRVFGVRVRLEKRSVKCLVLKAGIGVHELVSKGGEPAVDFEPESSVHFIRNQPLELFVEHLNELPILSSLPLVNACSVSMLIDLSFPAGFSGVGELKAFLEGIGFAIKEEEREMEVTVIYGE